MAALRNVAGFSTVTLDAVWDPTRGTDGLKPALTALRRAAERAARRGAHILVIRARVGLVAEAGDAFDIHHFATLIGYGAEAVHPWLGLETLDGLFGETRELSRRERERETEAERRATPQEARAHFRAAAEKGLLKILSKMGISTLSSYCGAQIFEVLGLGQEVIATCFAGTASPLGGIGFEEIAEDVLARHRAAYPAAAGSEPGSLPDHGRVRFRKEGEDHG